ncbi:DUF6265 family protein [Planctomycetaceae bacterium SH139]
MCQYLFNKAIANRSPRRAAAFARCWVLCCLLLFLLTTPARGWAKVVTASEQGFEITHSQVVPVSAERAFAACFQVSQWWNASHTYSGKAENLSLEPRVGAPLLEQLANGGAVEHLRLIAIMPAKRINLQGALGPLAVDGISGSLVMRFDQDETSQATTITWRYSVGGFRPGGFQELAPAVDGVLGIQLTGLTNFLLSETPAAAKTMETAAVSPPVAGLKQLTPHTYTFADDKADEQEKADEQGEADNQAEADGVKIEAFDFIVGHWSGSGLGGICEETWLPPLAGEMQGMFQFVNQDQVQFRELFALRRTDSKWLLTLKHFDAAMTGWEEKAETVDFPLIAVGKNTAWFKGLTMRRVDAETLIVHVAMKQADQSAKELTFEYRRKTL